MFLVFIETFVPLLSLFIFVVGTGFFATLLTLSMTLHQEPAILMGALTSTFYAGLVLGSFRVERFITRVGHIRAYAAFSAALAVLCLLHGIFYQPYLWLLLRFAAGIATAGLYVVIESWLLCKSTNINRGQVLALYMVTFYGAQSLGQFILNLGDPLELILFALASMMCSLSIIPLAMSYVQSPQFDEPSTLRWSKLIHQAASGLVGCFSAGMILSVIQGLMPALFSELFHYKAQVANYMFAIIFGGMLLQYPVGRISDVIERRLVLIMINVATVVLALVCMMNLQTGWLFFSLMVLFGGLTFTLYPISISHACDALENKDIVAGTQSLLLAYSLGAVLGPLIAPLFMHAMGTHGLFIYYVVVCGLVIPLLILRKTQKSNVPQEEAFISMAQTSPIMMELDPRGEESAEQAG
ncbi:MAG: MFS transporter [Legionellaceae bacterium]|nr:MFS transporter [Legionellaceae bacterium]